MATPPGRFTGMPLRQHSRAALFVAGETAELKLRRVQHPKFDMTAKRC